MLMWSVCGECMLTKEVCKPPCSHLLLGAVGQRSTRTLSCKGCSFLNLLSVPQEVADNQIDSGDLMECLIQNKHQKEMNEKCAIGVTHFQLVSSAFLCYQCKLVVFEGVGRN